MGDVALLQWVAILVGLAVAAVGLARELDGRSLFGAAPAGDLPDTRLALAVAVTVWVLTQIPVGLVLREYGASVESMAAVSTAHALVSLLVLRWVLRTDRRPTAPPTTLALLGGAAGLGVFGLTSILIMGIALGYAAAGVAVPQQSTVQLLHESGPTGMAVLVVSAVVLAPFAEEVFYRGVLLPLFARAMPIRQALLLQAFVFGFIHFWDRPEAWPLAIPLAVVGWAAGWIYHRTGSLLAAVLLHAAYNGVQVALLFALN